jgi:PAS domain S-box-containing protein
MKRADLLAEVFERAPVGVAVLDLELRYVYVNEALAATNGPSVEDHLGRTIEEVVPEVAAHARGVFQDVVESCRPLLGWQVSGETAAAPGELRHWVEDVYPLFEDGSLVALGVVIVDVTDRRRAEDEVREQHQRAQRLLGQLELGLIPSAPPPKRWRAAWRYRAAESEMLLGGDFVGLSERDDGSLEFVIGDVAGRGPAAAGVGASLRAGWKALMEAGLEPAAQMAALDRLIGGYGGHGLFATACCGRVSGMEARIVSAGHHPPLRLSPAGHLAAELQTGPALGISTDPRWPTNLVALDRGTALLLFTDGSFEGRRSASSTQRLDYAGLAKQIPEEALRSGDVAGCLDELLVRIESANGGPLDDDVALLLIGASGENADA